MTVPATRLEAYNRELDDYTQLISPFRLHQIAKDCERDISATRDSILAAALHNAAGRAYGRIPDLGRAEAHFRIASKLVRDWTYAANHSLTLALLGRGQESLAVSQQALAVAAPKPPLAVLVNHVHALTAAGDQRAAWDAIALAYEAMNSNDPLDLFRVARAAAFAGDDVLAVRTFARFLSLRFGNGAPVVDALAFIRLAPAAWWQGLSVPEEVAASMERVMADPVATALASAPEDDEPIDEEDNALVEANPSSIRYSPDELRDARTRET